MARRAPTAEARRPRNAADPAAMARAIRDFLAAAGLDPRDTELRETPRRVAEAWMEDFLDGYLADPAAILSELHPATSRDLVVVRSIDFHSMCPHHLIPYRGIAHVGYLPARGVVGFGTLVQLVDAFAHRLILQEEIGERIVESLTRHLGSRGAACVLEAEQGCVTMRGAKRRGARTVTRSFRGALATPRGQRSFLEALA